MSFIIYPQQDNKLAVIIPCGDVQDAVKDVPEGKPYAIVDSLDVDNDYFDAYDYHPEDGAVVNISNAQLIHLDKFRKSREPILQKLDIAYMKALETEDTVAAAEIAVKKQELRDVTKVELPNDLAGIKATFPEILNS